MNALLAPSLLSADLAHAGDVCLKLEQAGIKWLHLDVMDGHFVPNITFGPSVIQSLRKACGLFFDVHLMIEKPEQYVDDFIKAGADLLVIHLETTKHPQLCLEKIRSAGVFSGLALNPGTDFHNLRWLLPYIDLVLVMGVNPGFSGQKFIPQTLEKLEDLRLYLKRRSCGDMPVEVDGGASPENFAELLSAGANVVVSGSAFFREKNFAKSLNNFEKAEKSMAGQGECSAAFKTVSAWRCHFLENGQ